MSDNKDYTLVGEKTVLVPYLREHVEKYHEWMQQPFLLEATASEPLSLQEEYDMQVTWQKDTDKATFIVLDTSRDNQMAGDVNLYFNQDDKTHAEIEIMIAEESSRRNGLGIEAAKLMMCFGCKMHGIKEYIAKIGDANQASINMFTQKLKFEFVSHCDVFKETTFHLPLNEEQVQVFVKFLDGKLKPWIQTKELS